MRQTRRPPLVVMNADKKAGAPTSVHVMGWLTPALSTSASVTRASEVKVKPSVPVVGENAAILGASLMFVTEMDHV